MPSQILKLKFFQINIDESKKNIVSNNAITNFEIEIFPNQKYLWQTQQINYSEVVFRLTNISKDNIQLKIKAHPQSKYQDVIHLVNKANELGIKKIGIYKN